MDGYLVGAFDMLNVRDLDLIAQATGACERLVVGVYSDAQVEGLFGRSPVVPEHERAELLRHLRGVGEVVLHDECYSPTRDVVVFAAADDPAQDHRVTQVLTPRRRSESQALHGALRSVLGDAVA